MRCLMTVAFLALSYNAAADVITNISLNVAGVPLFKSDPTGGLITATLASLGESAQGTAAVGTLKATASSSNANANNLKALVQFVDTLSFGGNGNIDLFQVPSGTLIVNGSGQASVISTIDVTGAGIPGFSTRFQKTVSTLGASFQSDDGPLSISVSNGETLTVLATLLTAVTGSADADYGSTDHVYITALTPGLQIISASGHDYSVPQSSAVPEPATVPLLLLGGLIAAARRPQRTTQ